MYLIPVLMSIVCTVSILYLYPKLTFLNDNGDPGTALYLTKYIENGDIVAVSSLEICIN